MHEATPVSPDTTGRLLERARALGANGGVCMVTFVPMFVSVLTSAAARSNVLDH